jgi:hypothetical protein
MKNFIFLIVIAVAIGFASCLKTVDYEKLSSNFVVTTNFDKSAAFNSYKTYYISDTVVNVGGSGADSILTGANAQQLVDAVKTNMNNRGYTFTAIRLKPDLGIRMGIVKVTTVNYYPGWWGGYPGWFPYWGGYYPYYYPWSTVYTYDTGTVITDMYDLKNAKTNGEYKAVWNTTSFGALGSGTSSNIARGVSAINQGFTQSPYLNAQ